jgi:hypothetical protein
MTRIIRPFVLAVSIAAVLFSCQKEAKQTVANPVSKEALNKIKALGFSSTGVIKVEDGYLVEGDIVLTDDLLNSTPEYQLLRIGGEEQYRTTNLVKSLPRTIKVLVSGLGSAYVQGTDLAISRYNALNLQLKFQRITSGTANITILGFNEAPNGGFVTLGSAGFPTSSGEPYSQIKMNTNSSAYGSNPNVKYVGSVIQHEIGHCIGMRHTDYMDRSYSCDGAYSNEGASNVGAILIPGTPSGPNANSWMLACSNGGDRTFNTNDRTALNYLY